MTQTIHAGRAGKFTVQLNPRLRQEFNDDPDVRQNLREIANLAVQYAYNLAAKATGKMASTIKFYGFEVRDGELHAIIEVGDGAEYWVFVEYGTGIRGASSRQPEPGTPPGYAHGSSPGMSAMPFMRPTLLYLGSRIGG